MFKRKAIAVAAGSIALFSGCVAPELASGLKVEPLMVVRNGVNGINGIEESERLYRIGRQYQGQLRYGSAEDAFGKALVLHPGHAEAHNALGTVYFAQGRMQKAEEHFKLAIAAAPERPHLHNNLGYFYLQTLRKDEAIAAFIEARRLDPANPRILNNLAEAQGAGSTPAAVPAATLAATPESAPTVQLANVAPQVWELQPAPAATPDVISPPADAPTAVTDLAAADAPLPAGVTRIEVSNGNGVTGLAKRVGLYLREQGYAAPRLTNDKPFNRQRTEIHYAPGAEQIARRLGDAFASPPHLVAAKLTRQIPVRLVLGKDFRESDAIARQKGESGNQIALSSKTERK